MVYAVEIRQEEAEWAAFQAQSKQRGEPWVDADGVRHVPPKTDGPYVVRFEDRYDPDAFVMEVSQDGVELVGVGDGSERVSEARCEARVESCGAVGGERAGRRRPRRRCHRRRPQSEGRNNAKSRRARGTIRINRERTLGAGGDPRRRRCARPHPCPWRQLLA